jgi:hypothetical protein
MTHTGVIDAPEVLPLASKLRRNIGKDRPGAVDEDHTRKGVLPTALIGNMTHKPNRAARLTIGAPV